MFIPLSKSLFLFCLASVVGSLHFLSAQHQECVPEHFSALLELKTHMAFSYYKRQHYYRSETNLSSWNPENRDCCTWEGITCDGATGHVTTLYLSEWNIAGKFNFERLSPIQSLQVLHLAYNPFNPSPIPSVIGQFTSLTHLNLSHTRVYGEIPLELSSLTALVSLDLSGNGYYDNGSNFIPLKLGKPGIGPLIQNLLSLRELHLNYVDMSVEDNQWSEVISSALPNLRKLSLSNCSLSGTIHPISRLHFLSELNIGDNNFSSTEFHSLGNLSSLKSLTRLFLYNCSMSGSIPSWFTSLRNLRDLDLSQNNLTGIIPSSLFTHPSLQSLMLGGNQLGGQLSEFRNSSSSPLEVINLSYNQLHGMIPRSIFRLRKLKELALAVNNFSGSLDVQIFTNLTQLFFLDLSNNALEGSLPILPPSLSVLMVSYNNLSGEIPTSICNASSLEVFVVYGNNFSGHIPRCFGKMSNSLFELDLAENSLNGNFFQTFEEGCSLEKLDLSKNLLEGKLPISLANCKNLTILNLDNNQIQDTFPSWIQGLAYLRVLILRFNNFYGPIELSPTCQNLSKLQIIDISFNNFNGSLPSTMFCGWKQMTGEDSFESEYLQIHIRNYVSYFEELVMRIKRLEINLGRISAASTIVDLSRNQFQGRIPESIGTLKSLWVLNISGNGFTGQIPRWFRNLTALESLDLSQNNFSGNIPPELSELTFLEVLNLSENQLIGSIPNAKQFSTFTNESFQGNPGLCGAPLSKVCKDTTDAPSPTIRDVELFSERELSWRTIATGFGIGYGVGLGAFCWVLVSCTKGRRVYNKFLDRMLSYFCHILCTSK